MAPLPTCGSVFPLLYLLSKSTIEAANGNTFECDPSTFLSVSANYDVIRTAKLARSSSVAGTLVRMYAQYSMLRLAYVTMMMSMPNESGPGLEEDTKPLIALAQLT
ncbi:hypothetical protein BPOR_0456g00050 [Botrytis porri]|uniref:Uncharacterized protein n=1 Tax=Botrytis porri TaxID=87229 RepID=A0A4Z1KH54_9HELO|nr:hypothetical protein BPOR_0456g00050 [Botrytis porri]